MLSQLSVKNLAIVEQIDLSFASGMSVVTGETGAGKSIILQALNLVLGARADATLVRRGKSNAQVSAAFEIFNHPKIQAHLNAQSLQDSGECVLRRIISADGRSKAFVNGVNVSLSVLRGVGEMLIDMHGQNEHQLLLRPEQQRELLDSFADAAAQCVALNKTVSSYIDISNRLDMLNAKQDLLQQQKTLLQHQLDELGDAALEQNELDNIESDFKASANASSLTEKTANILSQIEGDAGLNAKLSQLGLELSQVAETDKKLLPIAQMLINAQIQTQEGIYELTHYLNSLSNNEQNTAELEQRLSELHNLARKHNCQINQLLDIQLQLEKDLSLINNNANERDTLIQQQSQLETQYYAQSQSLSAVRIKSAKTLSASVTEIMQRLGMPGSVLKIALPSKTHKVHYNGAETVDFLVTTNAGQDFKALKKVASGGELSRISLAISVISGERESMPTLIFDEVDVGISGAVAQVVGRKLKQLSKYYQVICITHLAQVAAFGHQHLCVSKTQNKDGTQACVTTLLAENRVNEVARILSGETITDKARQVAQEMITLSLKQDLI